METYLLPRLSPNGNLRAIPLRSGALPARPGARKNPVESHDGPLPNRGPELTEERCAARFVKLGNRRVRVGELTGEQAEEFLETILRKMYPDNKEAVTTKFRYLVGDGEWDGLAKWWAFSELERFAKGKKYRGKPIQVFVA